MERERAALWVSLLLLALAALVATGSAGLDWDPGSRDPASGQAPAEDTSPGPDEVEDEPPPPDPDGPRRDPGWRLTLTGTFVLLGLLAAAVLTAAVLVRLRLRLRRRRTGPVRGLRSPALPEADGLPEPEELAAVVDTGLAALDRGRPRNGVVAAWVALEQAVEVAGVPHDAADTAADLACRTLAAYRVDAAALEELAGLYREARFSRHPIGEPHRDRARSCLERLRADLRAGSRR